jgi:hypothetical protein
MVESSSSTKGLIGITGEQLHSTSQNIAIVKTIVQIASKLKTTVNV